jgi:hypothetical protein
VTARAQGEAESLAPEPGVEEPRADVDVDALLVALVLVPESYPRNRFYGLYSVPAARRARRRAAMLRSLIADLARDASDIDVGRRDGQVVLRYRMVDLRARRSSRLTELELALVRLAVERACGGPFPVLDGVPHDTVAHITALVRRLYEP